MKEQTSIGEFEFSGNEVKVDATIDDTPKVRGGRPTPGALFVIGGDLKVPDPDRPGEWRRLEKGFVKIETDDSGRFGGQVEFHAQEPGTDGDGGMKRLLTVGTRAIVCHVPLVTLAGTRNTEPLWPWLDPTHGIRAGDFDEVFRIYGFRSEDEEAYRDGRIFWEQVIIRMDMRDGNRKFPNTPPPPPTPVIDDWLTREIQEKRAIEIDRIRQEMAPTLLDEGRVAAYMSGRNRNLAEVHDDELLRADPKNDQGQSVDPCGGANRIQL